MTAVNFKCPLYSEKYQEMNADPDKLTNYKIRDNRLLRKVLILLEFHDSDSNDQWKMCVLCDKRSQVPCEIHDASAAGHFRKERLSTDIHNTIISPECEKTPYSRFTTVTRVEQKGVPAGTSRENSRHLFTDTLADDVD
jgi:hypothetical protein